MLAKCRTFHRRLLGSDPVEGDLSPRFALDGGNSGNIVVDYLVFLYRNYAPAKWLTWAESEWNREFASAIRDRRAPLFSTIADAFIPRAGRGETFPGVKDCVTVSEKVRGGCSDCDVTQGGTSWLGFAYS
jgi:hypothetical protein